MTSVGGPAAQPAAEPVRPPTGPEPTDEVLAGRSPADPALTDPGVAGAGPAQQPGPAHDLHQQPYGGPAHDPHQQPYGGPAHDPHQQPYGVAPQPYPVAEPDRLTRVMTRLYDRAPRWTAPVAALGCVAAGIGYALISDPTRSAPDALPSCLLKLTTGLDCPGCGGTRALWYLLHGDLPAAARHHFLFIFAIPFLAYLYLAWAARQSFGWRLPELRLTPKVLGGFLAAWLLFSVLRNLPWAPFTALYV